LLTDDVRYSNIVGTHGGRLSWYRIDASHTVIIFRTEANLRGFGLLARPTIVAHQSVITHGKRDFAIRTAKALEIYDVVKILTIIRA